MTCGEPHHACQAFGGAKVAKTKSQQEKIKDHDKLAVSAISDPRRVVGGLRQSKLRVTSTLIEMLEPGDRRFIALGWEGSLFVYDGWTEYTIKNAVVRDIFDNNNEIFALLGVDNARRGCGSDHILIDFAQGTIYAGDETCVEKFLEAEVDKQYQRSLLYVVVGSLSAEQPLDDDRCKAV